MSTQYDNKLSHKERMRLAEGDFLAQIAEHSQFAATLHTNIKTQGLSVTQMTEARQRASSSLYQLRLRFNRATTGKGWLRKPDYTPIFVPALEGSFNTYDRHRTLHYHVVIGNLPQHYDSELLGKTLRGIWTATDVGADDIQVEDLYRGRERGWTDYISKEYSLGNTECIDYHNAQLPPYLRALIR